MSVIGTLKERISGKGLRIVFPEGADARILGAAVRHQRDGILHPIVLGKVEEIRKTAIEEGFDLEGLEMYDPLEQDNYDEMVDAFVERRKGKATREQAYEQLKDPNYYGTMLVYKGMADGMVSGAVGTTGNTVRPALQILKTKPGTSLVSGVMVMIGPNEEKYIFADTAININPTAEQLAEIAYQSAETAERFGIAPRVAMLSFSTKGSASSPEQKKAEEATRIAKERYPELLVDGEMQFDAAIVPKVGQRKAPGSKVAGYAEVFIFPDLQAGNIGYKIAERLGNYEALGPILQGLAKPVNDLSRGCSEEDAYKLAIITAASAL